MSYPSPRSLAGGAAAHHQGTLRIPDPQGPPPPLPDGIPFVAPDLRARLLDTGDAAGPLPPLRVLREGCYLLRYTPLQTSPTQPGAVHYFGTLRVQLESATVTASGDLYIHRIPVQSGPPASLTPPPTLEPDPSAGIPVFTRKNYRYYLRVNRVLNTPGEGESFTLAFELYRFTAANSSWSNEGPCTALMSWTTAPPGYPSSADYLTGEVKNASGVVIASLTMGWVSHFLRRAVVEIDRVNGGVAPRDNGNGTGWREAFEAVGWNVTVIESDTDVPEQSGASWSDAEMHAAMLDWRDRRENLLDLEWRYHILCVRLLDETERGIMYDAFATDSNNVPREGVGIASDWVFPQNEAHWGRLRGLRFGDEPLTYFRTAVHELGHALGLYHNTADMGFMNTTDFIAKRARPSLPFPDNIRWAFHPDDRKRLRHMPDVWVRPGGIPFGQDYNVSPINADDLAEEVEGLTLEVRTTHEQDTLPLGAPARISFSLVNVSEQPIAAPASLSLKTGFVKGKVIDPAGTVRTFLPLVRCLEEHELTLLQPGQSVSHCATLLRGPQGALFPSAGLYRVIVEVEWDFAGQHQIVAGEACLLVTAAQSEEQSHAAFKILSTPDTLLTLALGGDRLGAGIEAVQAGINDPVLRPHYAWIEAKRLGRSFRDRKMDLSAVAELLAEAIMSPAELRRAIEMVEKVQARGPALAAAAYDSGKGPKGKPKGRKAAADQVSTKGTEQLVDALRKKVQESQPGEEIASRVAAL